MIKNSLFVFISSLLLFTSCSSVIVKKPIIDVSNSDNINLGKYYYFFDGDKINLYEFVDLSTYDSNVGSLYTLISPTDKRGGNNFYRFYKRAFPNQYIYQDASIEKDSNNINLGIIEINKPDEIIIYLIDNSKLKFEIDNSNYFSNLGGHISSDDDIVFDSLICTKYRSNILNFFKYIEVDKILGSSEDSKSLVLKKVDKELYNYFLKKYILESTKEYIEKVEKK